jgi:hypothetical protein
MRTIHLLIFLLIGILSLHAQETKARVTVTATGEDINEAKNLALRSAIEQAFGAYISSNTEILNDELIKDEIISISSGNIDSIHVISETKLVDGRTSVSLLAVVSVNKLVTFCESKGYKVEFKGGLFSTNIKQQKLNETAELKALENICEAGKSILNKSFDYSLIISEPQKGSIEEGQEMWNIVYKVSVKPNSNLDEFKNYVFNNISKISMTSEEISKYSTINKAVFKLKWVDPTVTEVSSGNKDFYFRNIQSLALMQDLFWHAQFSIGFFKIASNVDSFDVYDLNLFPGRGVYKEQYPVWPGRVNFSSTLVKPYSRTEEFFSLDDDERKDPGIPVFKDDYSGIDLNFNLGTIYGKRSEFFKETTEYLNQQQKALANSSSHSDSAWHLNQIQSVQPSLRNFYKGKYIYVLQDDNSRGRYEDLWERGYYIEPDDELKIQFGIDSNYQGLFVFSRAFSLAEIEKISNVEVFPAGRTLGL